MSAAGRVYWLTGLSGAGKSTIATALKKALAQRGVSAILLDGDAMRGVLGAADGYAREDRLHLAMVYARLCRLLSDQGFVVICATVSLFHRVQAWNREHIADYVEVLVTTSHATLMTRDQKNLYSGAATGAETNVVGVDIEPEFPTAPDLNILNDGADSPESIAARICDHRPVE